MKKLLLFLTLLFCFTALTISKETPKSKTGRIIVEITNIESEEGQVLSHLFDNEDDFPTNSRRAVMWRSGKPENGKCTLIFDDIPYGEYAFTTHHDANKNYAMDKTWLGFPDEGWGVSNDAEAPLILPKYEDAKVILNSPELKIRITMRY